MIQKAIKEYIREAVRVGMSLELAQDISAIMFRDTKTAKYYLLTQNKLK